ncbi:Dihydrolipoyllysine-residue succinyltransferase component of 2-oxoglutarate dehydrogenase complex, mitochondrial [Hypsibius exemplaris]|uniref:Dihydrolipoyllysine-residue succinyltransferase component of 2-oxoglutarate dehydrogenase complex, mitochondrial n=1 Tax=Hypsibius exemplaris TaxID=2072580 RepID=A0A1W0W9P6_HYPEX|nr:Dihydrolipoyllysine-residue succinyltransferase component of 2-oxoglutarate dehydrogenase complex, mitochondrial [Hypsibius exemplaris]
MWPRTAQLAYRRSAALSRGFPRQLHSSTAALNVLSLRDNPHPSRSSSVPRSLHSISGNRGFHFTAVRGQEIRTVKTPPFADSISEGDVRWHKAVGDQIKEDDVVGEIETDKTSIPVPSPVSGVITELLFKDGEKVTAGAQLYRVQIGGTGKSAGKDEAKAEEKPEKQAAPVQQQPSRSQSENSGPIPTSAPKVPPIPQGPIRSKPASEVPVTPSKGPSTSGSDAPQPGARTENRVKMNRMRLRIAERLKEAQNTAAMLTTFNEIDMSNVIEMRNKYKDGFQKVHGVKLGFMSAFVKAAAYALKDQPVVNAVIDGGEIVYHDYIDISVAVASPKGLVVPVIRNVENMTYADIEKTIVKLGEKARDNQLAIEDMSGGTFTISNGGVFGSLMGTPIINPPQSAILGMHATNDRPVAINGQVVIRPMMYVALTYDHRLIDGREAVTFLKKIKAAVEDPRTLLLEL